MGGKGMYQPDSAAYHPLLYYPNSTAAMDENLIIRTKSGTWQDIVMQVGASEDWPQDFPHMIHKHFSKFWWVGSGTVIWNYTSVAEAIAAEPSNFNLVNPPYRDTFITDFTGQMWIVVRYQVTNPGPVILHCHIESHPAAGMAVAIMDGVDA